MSQCKVKTDSTRCKMQGTQETQRFSMGFRQNARCKERKKLSGFPWDSDNTD